MVAFLSNGSDFSLALFLRRIVKQLEAEMMFLKTALFVFATFSNPGRASDSMIR